MQFGDFFFDGDKKKIYEAPSGFSYTLDGDGYRIYTPDDEPTAPVTIQYSTYELWSRYVDYMDAIEWAEPALAISGGAYRYTDQFLEDKYSLIDIRLLNDWAFVQSNYPHTTFIKGNIFGDIDTDIIFDSTRITRNGVTQSVLYSDAGERSVADAEAQAVANASLVYASFAGAVWMDSINGKDNIGTDTEPNGNQERPVIDAPLALAVCLNRGFRTINVLEDYNFILGDDISKKHVKGVSHISTNIDIGYDAVCYETIFTNVNITGTLDGNSEINNCVIGDIVYFNGHIHDSALLGTIYLGGNTPAKLVNCSMARMDAHVELDCGGSGQDAIMDYKGIITISNLTGANAIGLSMSGGIVTIDSTCTAGTIIIQGNFELIDNSGDGCTVNTNEKLTVYSDLESLTSDVDEIAIAREVWIYGTRELTSDVGLTPEQEAKLDQMLIDIDSVPAAVMDEMS